MHQTISSSNDHSDYSAHYENFPVASWLCPPRLRPAISAIYAFARVADDIADEGNATSAQRLERLNQYRHKLKNLHELQGSTGSTQSGTEWAHVFNPLKNMIEKHALPMNLLEDLLSAFEQDVRYTDQGRGYVTRAELLEYCRLSANPVGRLLLHLYGVTSKEALAQSDAICTALQLINFWQDLSQDLPRGRFYLPEETCQRHGITRADLLASAKNKDGAVMAGVAGAIEEEMLWAQELMHEGQALALRLPGRVGWELRLVVEGGLCIARKVLRQRGASIHTRLTVKKSDFPQMLWRAMFISMFTRQG